MVIGFKIFAVLLMGVVVCLNAIAVVRNEKRLKALLVERERLDAEREAAREEQCRLSLENRTESEKRIDAIRQEYYQKFKEIAKGDYSASAAIQKEYIKALNEERNSGNDQGDNSDS